MNNMLFNDCVKSQVYGRDARASRTEKKWIIRFFFVRGIATSLGVETNKHTASGKRKTGSTRRRASRMPKRRAEHRTLSRRLRRFFTQNKKTQSKANYAKKTTKHNIGSLAEVFGCESEGHLPCSNRASQEQESCGNHPGDLACSCLSVCEL